MKHKDIKQGDKIRVNISDYVKESHEVTISTGAYPWVTKTWKPCTCIATYPNYIVCRAEPAGAGIAGTPKPYNVTFDKYAIDNGMIKIRKGWKP